MLGGDNLRGVEVLTGFGMMEVLAGLGEVKDVTGLYLAWKSLIQSLEESEAVDEEGEFEDEDEEEENVKELDKS